MSRYTLPCLLLFLPCALTLLSSVDVGEFRLQLENGIFNITHKRDQYARSLLASPAGGDPLITAQQVHTDWSDHDGMFSHKEKLKDSCLSLTELALTEQGLTGNLCNHTMTLMWRIVDFRQLSLSATISDSSAYNRITIKLDSPSDEVNNPPARTHHFITSGRLTQMIVSISRAVSLPHRHTLSHCLADSVRTLSH